MKTNELCRGVLVTNRISRNQGIVRRVGRPLKSGNPLQVVVRARMFWWDTRRRWRNEDRVWSVKRSPS